MKLIDSKTRERLITGQVVTTFRGERAILVDMAPPKNSFSTGRVYIQMETPEPDHHGSYGKPVVREYYPSVINAEWDKDNGK